MRRARQDRRLFRGAERSRLTTLVLLLVMLCVLIPTVRSRTDWFSFFVWQTNQGGAPPADADDKQPAAADGAKTAAATTAAAKTTGTKTATAKTATAKTATAKTVVAPGDKTAIEAPAPKSSDPSPAAKSTDRPPPKSLADVPPPAPLDDEQLERERLKELLSVVQDGLLKTNPREMHAYYHLLKKANSQPLEVLQKDARRDPKFNDFHQFAPEHRGELVQIDLNLRRIDRTEVEEENVADAKEVYELWGWTQQAKAWLYVGITSELPPGLKVGEVEERVTLVGYFFKMQAYQPGDAKSSARPMLAPAIIGRVIWHPRPPPAKEPWWMWAALAGVFVVVVGFLAFRILGWRKGRRPVGRVPADGRAQIGDWLQPAPTDDNKPREQPAEPEH